MGHPNERGRNERPGRNDPCWCGSGRKFKHCHLGRDRELRVATEDIVRTSRAVYGERYCLHPHAGAGVCNGTIVRAHSVQRRGGLSEIARDGHVYNFVTDVPTLQRTHGLPAPRLLGLKSASTFTGFCGRHDNALFEPIEKQPFNGSYEHVFLLAYRAVCKELFMKRAASKLDPLRRAMDRGRDVRHQVWIQSIASRLQSGYDAGIMQAQYYKDRYDDALMRADYSGMRFYMVRFDRIPDVLCSGLMQPEYDFQGRQLQVLDNLDTIDDHLTFSLIATGTEGVAIFSWLEESRAAEHLVASLAAIPDEQLPQAILRFVFEHFENLYASPKWWEGLSDGERQALLLRQLSDSPYLPREANCLKDDGLRLVSWLITERVTNLPLGGPDNRFHTQ